MNTKKSPFITIGTDTFLASAIDSVSICTTTSGPAVWVGLKSSTRFIYARKTKREALALKRRIVSQWQDKIRISLGSLKPIKFKRCSIGSLIRSGLFRKAKKK